MTTTPNYGFSIAEGTDNVNLLTQSYPNFTNLDSILKTIEETGITTSVATKVGTVFQIVRTNTDLAVMRFVATANYAAGDTFTVDGVSVTATGMNGAALPAGAFVINQSVECILNGTVLTVVGVGGVSAVDAEDVDYDNSVSGLTATDVQAAIDEVYSDIPTGFAGTAISYDNTGSGLTATNVQDAIDELASGGGVTPVILATSAANQTWGAQIAEIKTTFTGLTDDQKLRTYLVSGNNKYSIGSIAGAFYTAWIDTAVHVLSIRLDDVKRYAASNNNITDTTTSNNVSSLQLIYF